MLFFLRENQNKSILVILRKIIGLLTSTDKRKLLLLSFVQVSLGFLDLLGVLGIGLLGSLSITNIRGGENNQIIQSILVYLNIGNKSAQFQIGVVASISLFFLVLRTVLSIIFTRKILVFLSHRSARVTSLLVSKLLSRTILEIQSRTHQENIFALTTGVQYLLIQVLATCMVIISDISILLFILIGLILVDPILALLATSLFGSVGFLLYRVMNGEAQKLGRQSSRLKIANSEKVVEAIRFYREAFVHDKTNRWVSEIGILNSKYAEVSAKLNFMPYVSKYVIETSIIFGAILISAVQFALHDITSAVTALSLFLASSTRIAPAVLRVQQGFVSVRSGLGQSEPTLELIDEMELIDYGPNQSAYENVTRSEFTPEIVLTDVSLVYPGSEHYALNNLSLNIPSGLQVAIVGPSGSGKSTLVDVILGILPPSKGSVSISGLPPVNAIKHWPGRISYVPQEVYLTKGSIRDNIILGCSPDEISEEEIDEAISKADLRSFLETFPASYNTSIGEDGTKLSAGQRQRIGIARALVTRPQLLILDESTSSLDLNSEHEIATDLEKLKGEMTVIMIAHRLTSIKDADLVIYLDSGSVLAKGTISDVRSKVPAFDANAYSSGL